MDVLQKKMRIVELEEPFESSFNSEEQVILFSLFPSHSITLFSLKVTEKVMRKKQEEKFLE